MTSNSQRLEETFTGSLDPSWIVTQIGSGAVIQREGSLWMRLDLTRDKYSNAQIADYPYPPKGFRWRPPLRMTVRAWARAQGVVPIGTAGFGFWNHPFSPDVKRLPRLPRALWFFFGSSMNNMQLALDVPGYGWKAATIDATQARSYPLIPFALPLVLLMRRPALYRPLWKRIQPLIGVSERSLPNELLRKPHTYTIDWRRDGATFSVDGEIVHESPYAPRGDMGFIAWMDNQYAWVTPQGRIGFGLNHVEGEQALILEHIKIERL